MRLLLALAFFITSMAQGQIKTFDLTKLGNADFKNFIAKKKIIVVGEMHGTTEVPLFVLQLVRQLQESNEKLTIGLEIPINNQRDIDDYLKTVDFDKLLILDYFKYPYGRTSVPLG